MDEQRQDDQLEPTHSSSVPIRDAALSGVSIVTSLNDTSVPRAREHLRSCCI